MKCIILGGSGEVGRAVARELIKSEVCSHLTMLLRRPLPEFQSVNKVEQIVVEMDSVAFEALVKETARAHDVAISCVGIGSGTVSMSEETMMAVEVDLVSRYARSCRAAGIEVFELLTAVGVDSSRTHSRIKGLRVLAKKHAAVVDVGFQKLAVFKPGMIVGNAHTPAWLTPLTALIPDSIGWGNIMQEDVAKAFVAHLEKRAATQVQPVVSYGNREMKNLIRN